jgi:acetolactate synthase-1/3 small subunit
MTQWIHIEIDHAEGSLIRVLGLIERRGFYIRGLSLSTKDETVRCLSIEIKPRDEGRTIATLKLQIDRLYGIKRVDDFAKPSLSDSAR